MKQMMFPKGWAIIACALALCVLATTLGGANTAQYFYDPLGRLAGVVDGQGNVATYNYAAVGNPLSITRNTGGVGVPTITGLTPNTGNPAVASALVSGISISPVASKTISVGLRGWSCSTTVAMADSSCVSEYDAPRQMAIFKRVCETSMPRTHDNLLSCPAFAKYALQGPRNCSGFIGEEA